MYKKFAILLTLILLMTACGGGDASDEVATEDRGSDQTDTAVSVDEPTAEPTSEPEPTNTPEPEPTNTPEPEPTNTPEPEPTNTPEPEPTDEPEQEPEEVVDESENAPVQASGDAGLACMGTSDGLSCLYPDGTWATFTRDNSDLPSSYVTAMTACSDGIMAISTTSNIVLFDGSEFLTLPEADFFSSDALACDDDGLWVAHFEGVSLYDGEGWTTFASSDLGIDDLVYDVMIAPNGVVWVLSSNIIASYDDAEWTIYADGSGFDDTYYFESLAVDSIGAIVASSGDGLHLYDDGVWSLIESENYYSPQGLVVTSDDIAFMGSFSNGLIAFDSDGWTEIPLSSDNVQDVTVDGNGRVWVSTAYGLDIWDGEAWNVYLMNNADLISNDIETAVVLAGGPALPALIDKAPGSLSGTMTIDGAPHADKLVEICVQSLSSYFSGDTPCSDQPLSFQSNTGADGSFSFSDVPVGNYVIVVETDDSWAQLTTEYGFGSEFTPVLSDENTDVGELIITIDE